MRQPSRTLSSVVAIKKARELFDEAARSALSFAFFAPSQAKYFSAFSLPTMFAMRHTMASVEMCPRVCPNAVRRPSSDSQRQPRSQ